MQANLRAGITNKRSATTNGAPQPTQVHPQELRKLLDKTTRA